MGDTLWSRNFGGENNDYCPQGIAVAGGGFALSAITSSYGSGDFDTWLIRLNDNGDSLWSKTYGRDSADLCGAILQTTDGGFALAGYTRSFGAGWNDFWIVRTDENGDSLWSRTYGGESDDQGFSIIESDDGGFVLAGGTKSFGAGRNDMWMLGISSEGDSLWSKTYGIAGRHERAHCLVKTTDGSYALAGYKYSANAYSDCYIVKTTLDGDKIWERTFPNKSNGYYSSLIATSDSGLVVTGWTGDLEDVWLVKVNVAGEDLWSQSFGGDSSDVAMAVAQTSDGSFVLAAQTKSFGEGNWDFYLVKTTPDPVSVRNSRSTLNPLTFNLFPAYPNPFNSSVTIPFEVSPINREATRVLVFDPLGRRVAELIPNSGLSSGTLNLRGGGKQTVIWDANGMPAGQYIVRLEAGNQQLSQRLSLVK